jgi:hypothetical protein
MTSQPYYGFTKVWRSDVEDFEQFYIAAKTEETPVNTPENDQ